MNYAIHDNTPAQRSGMQSYFDFMAARTGAGPGTVGQPEVLEFTGFETIHVQELQPVHKAGQKESRACSY